MFFTLLILLTPQTMEAPERYTRLVFRESPYAPLRGAVALTQEQANRRNHFKFTRDREGRLVRVSFHCGDKLKQLNDTANLFFHAPILHIRYEGTTEIRHYQDHLGNRVLFWGKVYESHYEYDQTGRRVGLTFHGKEGQKIENAWGIARYQWQHTGADTVIETRFNLAGKAMPLRPGFPFGRLKLQYGAGDFLERMQNINEQNQLVENDSGAAQDRLEYDEQGLVIAWNVLDKKGDPVEGNRPNVARGVISYNGFGDEIGIHHYDRNGQLMVNAFGFCASTTQYDRFGNIAMRTFLDADGKPTSHEQAGYQSLRMVWDLSGMRRLRLSLYGADGQPFNHLQRGYAEIVQKYDEKGLLAETRFFDNQGRLTTHRGLDAASIAYGYDARGRRITALFFDKTGAIANRDQDRPSFQLFTFDRAGLLETEYLWTHSELIK